jgi:hypothetical protein
MAKTKTKTETRDVDGVKRMSSSRKRSYKQHSNDDEMGKREVGENDHNRKDDEQPTATTTAIQTQTTPLAARPPKRKKRKKASEKNCRSSNSKKPLAGMTISVSTLSDNTKSKNKDTTTITTTTTTSNNPDHNDNDNDTETASNPNSYNEVCRSCKELGATVIDLVCKRVTILVCTEAAVKQATQRVRKAMKKNKPLVSVTWLEECQKQGRKVDFEEYRLDKKANDAIQNRENRLRSAEDALLDEFEAIPDSGWSEPKELG